MCRVLGECAVRFLVRLGECAVRKGVQQFGECAVAWRVCSLSESVQLEDKIIKAHAPPPYRLHFILGRWKHTLTTIWLGLSNKFLRQFKICSTLPLHSF